jgi:hypothetical protein
LRELRFSSVSGPDFDVCYRFEPAATDTRVSFEFRLRLPVVMFPLRERVANTVEHGSRRVVANLQTLLDPP